MYRYAYIIILFHYNIIYIIDITAASPARISPGTDLPHKVPRGAGVDTSGGRRRTGRGDLVPARPGRPRPGQGNVKGRHTARAGGGWTREAEYTDRGTRADTPGGGRGTGDRRLVPARSVGATPGGVPRSPGGEGDIRRGSTAHTGRSPGRSGTFRSPIRSPDRGRTSEHGKQGSPN